MIKKSLLILFGIVLGLLILEGGLRLAGYIVRIPKAVRNYKASDQEGAKTILCIGESTTDGQWPPELQKILDARYGEGSFTIIDKGLSGTNTSILAYLLPSFVDEYKPDLVIAMMGINDGTTKGVITDELSMFSFLRQFRVVKLFFLIKAHIQENISSSERENSVAQMFEKKSEKSAFEISPSIIKKDGTQKELLLVEKLLEEDREDEAQLLLEKLEDALRMLITQKEKNVYFYYDLAHVLALAQKGKDVDALLEQVRAFDRDPVETYSRFGQYYFILRQYDKARSMFEAAYEEGDKSQDTLESIFSCYMKEGDFSKAEKILEELQMKAKNYDSTKRKMFDALFQCEAQLEKEPLQLGLVTEKLDLLTYFECYELYEGFCDKMIEQYRAQRADNQEAVQNLLNAKGHSLLRRKEIKRAIEHYEMAVEEFPEEWILKTELAKAYVYNAQFDKAKEVFDSAESLFPKVRDTLFGVALSHWENGNFSLARKCVSELWGTHTNVINTKVNFNAMHSSLLNRGIPLVMVQYPMRPVEELKAVFLSNDNLYFVSNEYAFKEAVARESYDTYFRDRFGVDFGHCTEKGNRLLAENIARVLSEEVFPE